MAAPSLDDLHASFELYPKPDGEDAAAGGAGTAGRSAASSGCAACWTPSALRSSATRDRIGRPGTAKPIKVWVAPAVVGSRSC
jgi:hypothetical protein